MKSNKWAFVIKTVKLMVFTLVAFSLKAQDVSSELQEYFYPFAKFSFLHSPDSDPSAKMISMYSITKSGDILKREMEVYNGLSASPVGEHLYKLSIGNSGRSIISNRQIYKTPFGVRQGSDKLTLFVLPEGDKAVEWEEKNGDDVYQCRAQFVYITFWVDGKQLYRKAVKIEKETPLDSSSVKTWSYWIKGLSNLATYGYWGDPSKVSCSEISVNIDSNKKIKEIPKAEFEALQTN